MELTCCINFSNTPYSRTAPFVRINLGYRRGSIVRLLMGRGVLAVSEIDTD